MNVDRTSQGCLDVVRTGARGRRVDTERAAGPLQGRHLPSRLSGERHYGQHLQVADLRYPGQQVSGQQHAQPGDVL